MFVVTISTSSFLPFSRSSLPTGILLVDRKSSVWGYTKMKEMYVFVFVESLLEYNPLFLVYHIRYSNSADAMLRWPQYQTTNNSLNKTEPPTF